MGAIEKGKKRFKEPLEYYRGIFIYSVVLAFGLWVCVYMFSWSEEKMWEFVNDDSRFWESRLAYLLIRILMNHWGKVGFIIGMSFFLILSTLALYEQIAEYCRYKKKCKLFREGTIKNFYDIYDDHAPPSVWQLIKRLFTKKEKTYKSQYPSNRELKKQIKEFEKSRRR